MIVFGFFGLLLLILVVSNLVPQYSRRTKREQASIYARWLNSTYPTVPTKLAAVDRRDRLTARGPLQSTKVKQELLLNQWVLDGWHEV